MSQDFPPRRGGTQRYTLEVARQFSRVCRNVTVVVPGLTGGSAEAENHSFQLIRLPGREDTLSVRLVRWMAKANLSFDAVLCVQWPSALTLQLLRLVRPGIRIYLTVHGREVLFQPFHDPIRSALYRRMRHRSLHKAHHLFAVSRYTRDLLLRQGIPPHAITTVPNGVDGSWSRPSDVGACRQRLGVEGHPVLFTLGRLVEAKGIQVLLHSLPSILTAFPRLQLIIGGDGPYGDSLKDLTYQLGLADRVQFTGEIADQRLIGYYGACVPHRRTGRGSRGRPYRSSRGSGVSRAVGPCYRRPAPGSIDFANARIKRAPENTSKFQLGEMLRADAGKDDC